MTQRVYFCGAIQGSVLVRSGETADEALARAQDQILNALDRTCKSLGQGDGHGPNVGLELESCPA